MQREVQLLDADRVAGAILRQHNVSSSFLADELVEDITEPDRERFPFAVVNHRHLGHL